MPDAAPVMEVAIPPPQLSKGEREYRAFLAMLPDLLSSFRGRHVAIHEGQVVDSDADDVALVRRVHERVGYVPIYVGLVTDQPRVVRWPHFQEIRPRGSGG
jgi:hypothetical protein